MKKSLILFTIICILLSCEKSEQIKLSDPRLVDVIAQNAISKFSSDKIPNLDLNNSSISTFEILL